MHETDDLADVALAAATEPHQQSDTSGRRHLPLLAAAGPAVQPARHVPGHVVAELAAFATVAATDWFERHAGRDGLDHALAGVVHTAVAALLAAGVVTVADPPTAGGCPVLLDAGLDAIPDAMRFPASGPARTIDDVDAALA